ADGSGLRRVRRSTNNETTPTWSPDGNWLAFSSTPVSGGATDLFIMDLFGGNVKQLGGGGHPAWTK
ncbi:MAG: PD40 domain-containing protein, partial [Chloroflexi bacterium]|nr:PD40 domain-containing protein [Chloroflexota bacterium]